MMTTPTTLRDVTMNRCNPSVPPPSPSVSRYNMGSLIEAIAEEKAEKALEDKAGGEAGGEAGGKAGGEAGGEAGGRAEGEAGGEAEEGAVEGAVELMDHLAPESYGRVFVLGFLRDLMIETERREARGKGGAEGGKDGEVAASAADTSYCAAVREGYNTLVLHLLNTNFEQDMRTHGMPNGAIHGRKLRSWQALTILSRFLSGGDLLDAVNERLWRCVEADNFVSVRYYIEIVSAVALLRAPEGSGGVTRVIETFVAPRLQVRYRGGEGKRGRGEEEGRDRTSGSIGIVVVCEWREASGEE